MTPRPTSHRRLTTWLGTAGVAVVIGLGSGTAYAFWSASAAGTGTATTTTPQPVTVVSATGTVTSTLTPGGTADLRVALDNPNSFPVTITSISQNGPVPSPGGGCVNTGVTISATAQLPVSVASGSGIVVTVVSGAAMSLSSDSACQGQTFQIPISATVRR